MNKVSYNKKISILTNLTVKVYVTKYIYKLEPQKNCLQMTKPGFNFVMMRHWLSIKKIRKNIHFNLGNIYILSFFEFYISSITYLYMSFKYKYLNFKYKYLSYKYPAISSLSYNKMLKAFSVICFLSILSIFLLLNACDL